MAVGNHTVTVQGMLTNYSTALANTATFTLLIKEARFYSFSNQKSLTYLIGVANVPFNLKSLYFV
jgi:hypothetical protein